MAEAMIETHPTVTAPVRDEYSMALPMIYRSVGLARIQARQTLTMWNWPPNATYRVWVADTCERGLLHPVDELNVTAVPRLADLSMTAMRRDETGRAAGHIRAVRSRHSSPA